MLASSGCDGTVKLWTPVRPFATRSEDFEKIVQTNIAEAEQSEQDFGTAVRIDFVNA
jgi:hypothetical protein